MKKIICIILLISANILFADISISQPEETSGNQEPIIKRGSAVCTVCDEGCCPKEIRESALVKCSQLCNQLKDPKEIEECKKNCIKIMLEQNEAKVYQKDYSNNHTGELLTSMASILANIGLMTSNPANFQQSLTNILSGIVNVGSIITRKMPDTEPDQPKP